MATFREMLGTEMCRFWVKKAIFPVVKRIKRQTDPEKKTNRSLAVRLGYQAKAAFVSVHTTYFIQAFRTAFIRLCYERTNTIYTSNTWKMLVLYPRKPASVHIWRQKEEVKRSLLDFYDCFFYALTGFHWLELNREADVQVSTFFVFCHVKHLAPSIHKRVLHSAGWGWIMIEWRV